MNEVERSNRTNNPKGDTKKNKKTCIIKLLIETIDNHLTSPKDFITIRTFSIIFVLFSNHFLITQTYKTKNIIITRHYSLFPNGKTEKTLKQTETIIVKIIVKMEKHVFINLKFMLKLANSFHQIMRILKNFRLYIYKFWLVHAFLRHRPHHKGDVSWLGNLFKGMKIRG